MVIPLTPDLYNELDGSQSLVFLIFEEKITSGLVQTLPLWKPSRKKTPLFQSETTGEVWDRGERVSAVEKRRWDKVTGNDSTQTQS